MPSKTEPNVQIAKSASKMYSGADVSQKQLNELLAYVKTSMRSGILKHLACTESQLKRYATSDITQTDLPEKTRERLQNAAVYSKPWPRKTAAMLFTIHRSRKRPTKKSAPATDTE